jgi:hypothetical protein
MNEAGSRPIGRTILATLILVLAAWVLLHYVIHIVLWLASLVVIVAAVAALIWAVRVLL